MPRLLMVTTVPTTVRAFLMPFAQHFRRLGWRVDALAAPGTTWSACADAFDRVFPVEWSRNPLEPGNLRRAPQLVRALVEREDYDLVHVHTPVAAFVTRYALRSLRKRGRPVVIYTAHGFHFYRGGTKLRNTIFLTLESIAARWTDYLVVINQEDNEAARHYRLLAPERICYIPGIGIDLSHYCPASTPDSAVDRVRQAMKLSPTECFFLMIAEFAPNKRHRDALHALAALGRSHVHLAFAGEGPLQAAMQQLATDLGLHKQVHFLGQRRDIPTLISASVATLLLSQREGLPRSVMESLSLATPVIGASNRGARDLLAAGGGLLVEVGDVQGLAHSMAWIIDHPERAGALGRQGQAQLGPYDLRRVIALHEALYAQALAHLPQVRPCIGKT